MNRKKYKFGLIGCGKMGYAIARGAVLDSYLERYEICVYDENPDISSICRKESFAFLSSEKEVAENSHIVLLAVRPQDCDTVLERLKDTPIDCLVSIVTGVSIHYLQQKLNNTPIIRAMPNTPLQIAEGATALCMSANCHADDYDFVYQMFNTMGVTRTIPENQMEDIIAVHGSTPAYVYYIIDCLLKDAMSRGIEEEAARDLLVQTFVGSAELLKQNRKKPLDDFIDEVCSKGGTTIEAIDEMKRQNMSRIIHDCNEKCIDKAKKLGK